MQKKIQNTSNMNTVIGVVSGLMAGAAIGSMLSLMFAPCSGKEARKYIKKKTENMADTMKCTFQDLKDGMSD